MITVQYAARLVRQGKATVIGKTTDQPRWADRYNGKVYAILNRHDLQRIDHYEV
uniref:Uncharacterized protein n=1 Tax=viral metagenome TaxID=1070528 RepID=A0A6M3LBC8_9ZZZZ